MRNIKSNQLSAKNAQTAIEYLLLLTICALIVFVSFKTFFSPEGRLRNGLELYFNNVSNKVMGNVPVIPNGQ
mgnify:CR=1 FL=1